MAITGPRLYLTGAGGYETAHWFEQELNIEGEDLEEGHNVVNFSLQIARALGCNPLILIGVDLAFTGQRFYAEGIAANLNLKEEELKANAAADSQIVKEIDIHGKPVDTLWKWIAEARWISDFAKLYPDIQLINATEGGLGFEGIPNLRLKEAIERYLSEPQASLAQIGEIIRKHSLSHVKSEKIFDLMQEMKKSLDHCVFQLSRLIEECSLLDRTIRQGGSFPADLQTPHIALHEANLADEIGYKYLLEIFHQVFLHTRHGAVQDIRSPKRRLKETEKALKMLAIQKEKWIFLRDVAQVNREVILHAVALWAEKE